MADNTQLNTGSGGDLCAADDIGGVKYQRVKVNWGVDGSTVDASTTNPFPVTVTPATGGGYTNTSINSANSNNATTIKASAGQVYGVHVYNNAAYPIYAKLYNKASNPIPGSDTALLIRRIGVQAGTQRDCSFPAGITFSTGIGLVIVKGITDADNTSVLTNDCLVEVESA